MINYNDFPILTNEQYQQLNQHFLLNTIEIDDVINTLLCCKNSLDFIKNSFSLNIQKSICNFNLSIEEILNNLSIYYKKNFQKNTKKIKNNIFDIFYDILTILNDFFVLINNEQKSCYIIYLKKAYQKLNTSFCNLLQSLKESKFKYFKYM